MQVIYVLESNKISGIFLWVLEEKEEEEDDDYAIVETGEWWGFGVD